MTAIIQTPPIAASQDRGAGDRPATSEIAALDGVRGLAMLLVLWDHLTLASLNYGPVSALPQVFVIAGEYGDWGLHLFFILSGFLLFLPYARALLDNDTRWPSPRQFYARRARRILPLYFLAVSVPLIALVGAALQGMGAHKLASFVAIVLLFHNIQADAWRMISRWDAPLWSLAVEWQFYLVMPWIALGFRWIMRPLRREGYGRLIALTALLGALAAIGLSIRGLAAYLHYARELGEVTEAQHGLGFALRVLYGLNGGKYIETFAIGMATSVLFVVVIERKRLGERRRIRVGWLSTGAGVLGLALVAFWMHRSHSLPFPSDAHIGGWPDAAADWPWAVFGFWVMGLCCCAVTFGAPLVGGWLGAIWTSRVMRYAGKISYSGYVWHYMLIWGLLPLGLAFGHWATPWLFAATGILVVVVASLSYWLVERPFLPTSRWLGLPQAGGA